MLTFNVFLFGIFTWWMSVPQNNVIIKTIPIVSLAG